MSLQAHRAELERRHHALELEIYEILRATTWRSSS
jgi:hypothetical protein